MPRYNEGKKYQNADLNMLVFGEGILGDAIDVYLSQGFLPPHSLLREYSIIHGEIIRRPITEKLEVLNDMIINGQRLNDREARKRARKNVAYYKRFFMDQAAKSN